MRMLYDMINILPLSLLLVILFGGYAGIPEGSIPSLVICLIFTFWLIVLRRMKSSGRIRSTGVAAAFLAGVLIVAGEENRQLFISEYFWVIWVICFCCAAFAAGILMDRNIWARRAVPIALLAYCIAEEILEWGITKEAFALICFMLTITIAEEIQRKWKKSGSPDIREHVTRISPVLLAVCLLVYAIPAPDEPYDWKLAKDIWNSTVSCISSIYGYISHPTEEYGSIGFSDSGSFLAGLTGSNEEVLSITAGNTTIKDFRLVGCIGDRFTGREWVFEDEDEGYSRMLDTLETCTAVRKFCGDSQYDLLQKTDMHFENLLYNTRYIFSPAKIRLEATMERNSGISEKNGSIVSEQRLTYNDNYTVSCYVLNYGSPELQLFLENAGEINEAEWKQTADTEKVSGKENCSYKEYRDYRSGVYEKYCTPCGVSEEVRAIIDGIESGSDSRYEMLKKLEEYLKRMEYSTDCGSLPDSVTDAGSFLDNFLLESRKGWCMHYATAFVLMANEMGIPCRYVQGYNAKRGIGSSIVIMQNNAHAWPEAYFDNAGWIAFEPTPGFSVPAGWGISSDSIPAPEKDKSYPEPENEITDTSVLPENAQQPAAAIDPMFFIIPSLAVLGFLILFYIARRSAARKKYGRMSCYDKIRYLTRQDLRFLGYLGFQIEEGETLSEFHDRIIDSDRPDIKEFIGFIPVCEMALYSDRDMTEEDIKEAERINNGLYGLVKKSRSWFRLLLIHFSTER